MADFHYEEKVKLHSFEKLKSLAEKHQLSYVTRWGDYQLGLFSDNSPRCIILFQKNRWFIYFLYSASFQVLP